MDRTRSACWDQHCGRDASHFDPTRQPNPGTFVLDDRFLGHSMTVDGESRQHEASWRDLQHHDWDLIVAGGGITGAGIAREAARRGLRTLLLEERDYAWGTSSRSSKMVHGGLRYIAQGDICLTRHSLKERERLLREAPGLVTRMPYWYPHRRGAFPGRWTLSFVLALYDFFAGKRDHGFYAAGEFLAKMPMFRQDGLTGASRYTDALVDDARLVMRVLDEACADGAVTLNYAGVLDLVMRDGAVQGVRARNESSGGEATLTAKAVVNATGAWADRLRSGVAAEKRVRPQRGSHLVIASERLPVREALLVRHPADRRLFFIYPWEGRTLVGTTDVDHRGDLDEEASITRDELDYLLAGANAQFPRASLTAADVVATFSGVRPIVASGRGLDPSQERRDHVVWDDRGLVTVTGGKLTTFRLIAEDVLRAVGRHLPIAVAEPRAPIFRAYRAVKSDLISAAARMRLEGRFGFLTADFLAKADSSELEAVADTDVLWAELRWATRHEQVEHLDDLLLRRTRLGILLHEGGVEFLPRIGNICRAELAWDDERWRAEAERYREIWRRHYSLPLSL
jgi:glycerol-3-phosphate dehydrogenase